MPTISAIRETGARDEINVINAPKNPDAQGVADSQQKNQRPIRASSSRCPKQLATNSRPEMIHTRRGP